MNEPDIYLYGEGRHDLRNQGCSQRLVGGTSNTLKSDGLSIIFQGRIGSVIRRPQQIARLRTLLRDNPVVAILGARQVGKTTLARDLQRNWKQPCHAFDLERQSDLVRLADPELALEPLRGLVVLDEIQRMPDLFPLLRVLSDRRPVRTRFLVLGSASPELLRQGNETLAGRLALHTLDGFSLQEVGIKRHSRLWLRGGFPRAFLASSNARSRDWREDFISTFLERDLPQLGIRVGATTLRRFWTMLAHYHGQIWNASEFARSFGVNHTTIRHYLDILTSSLVGPATATLARKSEEASGQGTEGLPCRLRPVARAARNHEQDRPRHASETRCVMGGICDLPSDPAA